MIYVYFTTLVGCKILIMTVSHINNIIEKPHLEILYFDCCRLENCHTELHMLKSGSQSARPWKIAISQISHKIIFLFCSCVLHSRATASLFCHRGQLDNSCISSFWTCFSISYLRSHWPRLTTINIYWASTVCQVLY